MKARIPTALEKLNSSDQGKIDKYIEEEVERRVEERRKKWLDIVLDTIIMAGMIVLIERFAFGTKTQKGKQSKLFRYSDGVQQTTHEYVDKYGEAAREAMRQHLRNAGIEFEIK